MKAGAGAVASTVARTMAPRIALGSYLGPVGAAIGTAWGAYNLAPYVIKYVSDAMSPAPGAVESA
jgi:hypothetical protein